MKRSLLALALMAAFASAASAQSSVTIGGKIDLGVGKSIGTADKRVQDAAGSRLNFTIVEDLGGGLAAVAGFEHRLNPNDGTSASANFWNGYSYVGLRGGFGTVQLGRNYTAAFLLLQNQIDPWGGDTVAALRGVGVLGIAPGGNVAKIRFANGLRYEFAAAGFKFAGDISESFKNNTGAADATVVDRPWSLAATYAAGPIFVGVAHENPGGTNDKLTTLGGGFNMGFATLRAGFGTGTNNANAKVRAMLLAAIVPMGPGEIRVGYGTNKVAGTFIAKRLGLGYKYNLSKRTYLYTDVARDSATQFANNRNGYDLGIQHNF